MRSGKWKNKNRDASAVHLPRGDFEQSQAIAQGSIKERSQADTRKTQRLRALRLAGKTGSESSIPPTSPTGAK